MTQRKIDDLFSQKRSRINQSKVRDEFDEIFENTKRQRTNPKASSIDDIFQTNNTFKKKRSQQFDDEQNIQQKKVRCSETIDLLDMFNTRSNSSTTIDQNFKVSLSTTQKKVVKMFFDHTDRDDNDSKDYTQIKPVLITGGKWLCKEDETKSICQTSDEIPVNERNLMHVQYVPLIIDETPLPKSSYSNTGKSFQKQQLILSNSNIVRKENLQSCYNALLEDVNKPRLKSNQTNDDHQIVDVDFFDLSNRRRKKT